MDDKKWWNDKKQKYRWKGSKPFLKPVNQSLKTRITTAIILLIATIFIFLILPNFIGYFSISAIIAIGFMEFLSFIPYYIDQFVKIILVVMMFFFILISIPLLHTSWIIFGVFILALVSYFFITYIPKWLSFLVAGFGYLAFAAQAIGIFFKTYGGVHLLLILSIPVVVDSAAYFIGSWLGGPKLFPKVSPKKTWTGFIGGVLLGTLWGGLVLFPWLKGYSIAIALGLSVVAQAGDLLESFVKRKAGVKDSGNILPGHGGVLDRIDGYLGIFFVIGLYLLG